MVAVSLRFVPFSALAPFLYLVVGCVIGSSILGPRPCNAEDQQAASEAPPAEDEPAADHSKQLHDAVDKNASPVSDLIGTLPRTGVAKHKPRASAAKSKSIDATNVLSRLGKSPVSSENASPEKTPENEDEKDSPTGDDTVLQESKRFVGGIAMVLEKQSELVFLARVDTGAQSCSIHTEEFVIEDPAESMKDNIGKVVRIKLKNLQEEFGWVETRIERLVRVKTSDSKGVEHRYSVPLVLSCSDTEKEVRVTLNDRSKMSYPLLLGRNFLRGDFVVDLDVPHPK